MLVAFDVLTPSNALFELSARTDINGIATTNFTIQTPPLNISESDIFGDWFVTAGASIGGDILKDTLSFKVDWIVKLLSVKTIDQNLTDLKMFGKQGDVGLEITLRSIAMTARSADLSVVIQDENQVPINFTLIHDFQVQPNEKIVFLYTKLQIPVWAYVGLATVHVSAFVPPINVTGIPYCPAISTTFYILETNATEVHFDDIAAVSEVPANSPVEIDQLVTISVITQNEGTEIETYNVTAFCDDVPIGTFENITLPPLFHQTLTFILNTSFFGIGNHSLTASIPYLPNEADLTDNLFVDGLMEIVPKLPAVIHDIAIVDVAISSDSVIVGDSVEINVSVLNKGNSPETFSLGAFYNSSLVSSLEVNALKPDTQVSMTFVWDTSLVQVGSYEMSASCPLEGDINISDNSFFDGLVEVKTRPTPFHDVAILNVYTLASLVFIGDDVNIYVVVKNLGSFDESFYVMVSTNSTILASSYVETLPSGDERTLVFVWNTTNVSEGSYIISAQGSSVPGETNLGNNFYTDGTVTVATAPKGLIVPYWFYWALLALLSVMVIMLLFLWLYRRRKREEGSFYSGWAAWYYCYDPHRINRV
jgi:hypothetical protein